MDNGERILYRDMLRRTERATAREREIEQEKRSKISETRVSNHSTFFLFIYNALTLGLQSPQGARLVLIQPHLCPPTYSYFSRLWALCAKEAGMFVL
jgi:hypothetical protein